MAVIRALLDQLADLEASISKAERSTTGVAPNAVRMALSSLERRRDELRASLEELTTGGFRLSVSGQNGQAPEHLDFARSIGDKDESSFLVTQAETFCPAIDLIKFQRLRAQWEAECGITSSLTKIVLAPSYQRIIAMGPKAILLILRQLELEGDDPDWWFWALEMLTGDNPVPEGARGNTVAMAKAWLDWGQRKYGGELESR